MFKRFVVTMAMIIVLLLAVGGTRAEFNVDGILSLPEQEAVARDVKTAMEGSASLVKADIYPEGFIVVYYDDDVDGTCDNAILFQIAGFAKTEEGMLVPYVVPFMEIPTCADAESMLRMYIEEKNITPDSLIRKMDFSETGELTPVEYLKLVEFWRNVQKEFSMVVKVYIHEVLGVVMVFVDADKNGTADYVDHLYFSGFDSEGDPQYMRVQSGTVEEAEAMYQGYLQWLKQYHMQHSV